MIRLFIYVAVLCLAGLGLSSSIVVMGLLLVVPGLFLLAAPTVALYLPFADLMFTGVRRRRADLAWVALAGSLLVAIGPPLLGELVLRRGGNGWTGGTSAAVATAPDRVLLVRFVRSRSGDRHGLFRRSSWRDDATCEKVCAQLLMGGPGREVVRPLWSGDRPTLPLESGDQSRAFIYTLTSATECRPAESWRLRIPQELLATIGASGRCVSVRETTEPYAGAALTLRTASLAGAGWLPVPLDKRRLALWTAWGCTMTHCKEIARASEGVAAPLSMPFHMSTVPIGFPPKPREWSRREVSIDTTALLPWPALGLGAAPGTRSGLNSAANPAGPVSRSAARDSASRVLSVSAEGKRALEPAERAVIRVAIEDMTNRSGKLEPDDLRFLREVVRHPTLDEALGLDTAFRKHPKAAEELELDLVEAYCDMASSQSERVASLDTSLERALAGDHRQNFRRAVARAIELLPPDRLAVHRAGLLAALAKPGMEEDAQRVLRDLQR